MPANGHPASIGFPVQQSHSQVADFTFNQAVHFAARESNYSVYGCDAGLSNILKRDKCGNLSTQWFL